MGPTKARTRAGRVYFLVFGFAGTFAPARRACERPMAIACSRLVTFLPERPDLRIPRFRSRMACFTFWAAFFPYLAMVPPLRDGDAHGLLRTERRVIVGGESDHEPVV